MWHAAAAATLAVLFQEVAPGVRAHRSCHPASKSQANSSHPAESHSREWPIGPSHPARTRLPLAHLKFYAN